MPKPNPRHASKKNEGKHPHPRSLSAGPEDVITKRGRHAQMMDLLSKDERDQLKFNKNESAMTLPDLQDKIKRQAELYKAEFAAHFKIFQQKLTEFKENPSKKDQDMIDYFKFFAHVSHSYQNQIAPFLSTELLNLL